MRAAAFAPLVFAALAATGCVGVQDLVEEKESGTVVTYSDGVSSMRYASIKVLQEAGASTIQEDEEAGFIASEFRGSFTNGSVVVWLDKAQRATRVTVRSWGTWSLQLTKPILESTFHRELQYLGYEPVPVEKVKAGESR